MKVYAVVEKQRESLAGDVYYHIIKLFNTKDKAEIYFKLILKDRVSILFDIMEFDVK